MLQHYGMNTFFGCLLNTEHYPYESSPQHDVLAG